MLTVESCSWRYREWSRKWSGTEWVQLPAPVGITEMWVRFAAARPTPEDASEEQT